MKLSLAIPSFGEISNPAPNFSAYDTTLGSAITVFGRVGLFAGGFLMVFWAAWGVFDYIRAEGNKEALAKARKRIQWAIAGFIILIISFFLSDYVRTILAPQPTELQQLIIQPLP